jgi:hypothetical protein
MLFSDRWWEKRCRIFGGKSSTDLPIRTIVYPSHGFTVENEKKIPGEGSGLVIVSYTWAQDAARIGAIRDQDVLKDLVLSNLAAVHGIPKEDLEGLCEGMFVHDWYKDEFAQGAFALYGPGQFSSLFAAVVQPEVYQRLHFAGEATSVHHAWIVGSLNSAYRTVWEILSDDDRRALEKAWGTIEEVERPEEEHVDGTTAASEVPPAGPLKAPAAYIKSHSDTTFNREHVEQVDRKSRSDTTQTRKTITHHFHSRI